MSRDGSLGEVFDHVAIAVSDLAASERFYRTVLSVLGVEPSHADAELVEWDDWDIGPTDREHPVTRGLHVGFRAPSREAVDAFWQAGIDAGYRDDGAPGRRTVYGPDYYGGFLLDPDGNSAEAVHTQRDDPVPDGSVDHLWIRVRDPAASKRFYTTIAPYAGLELGVDEPDHVQFKGAGHSFSLIDDERPLTEHVHVAFPAQDDATVRAFHAAALAAGYEDHGGPGERAVYHPGYYGAFVLDPDGHNVEVRQPQPLSHGGRRRTPVLAGGARHAGGGAPRAPDAILQQGRLIAAPATLPHRGKSESAGPTDPAIELDESGQRLPAAWAPAERCSLRVN